MSIPMEGDGHDSGTVCMLQADPDDINNIVIDDRQHKYASADDSMRAAAGIQVFKQHHQPSFSRVSEVDAEDDEDSLDEKWR